MAKDGLTRAGVWRLESAAAPATAEGSTDFAKILNRTTIFAQHSTRIREDSINARKGDEILTF